MVPVFGWGSGGAGGQNLKGRGNINAVRGGRARGGAGGWLEGGGAWREVEEIDQDEVGHPPEARKGLRKSAGERRGVRPETCLRSFPFPCKDGPSSLCLKLPALR